jgi:hypothetical protein
VRVTNAVFTASAFIPLRYIPADAVKIFIQLLHQLQVRFLLRIAVFLNVK